MSNITTTIVLGSTLYPSPLTLPDTDSVSPSTPGAAAVYGDSAYTGATLTTAAYIRGGAAGVDIAAGIGVDLTASNIVTNGIVGTAAGQIFGGVGSSDDSQFTGVSGSGGIGVSLSGGSTLNNTLGSTVTGGKGGYYGRGTGMVKGGTGGDGVYVKYENGGTINNYGRISGGIGGVYSQAGLNVHGPGYSGGTGGIGVDLSNSGSGTLINASTGKILGGSGGGFIIPGGGNEFLTSGSGGDGVQVWGGSVLENYGQIAGGNGGDVGGTGGRGLYQDGGNVRNQGSITGGSGGGMGAYVSSGFLSNAGTITGGEGGGAGQYNGGEGVFVWKYGTFTSYGQYGSVTGGKSFEGQGGTGVEIYGTGQLLNNGFLSITGGAGAYGGTGLMLDASTPYSQAYVTLTGHNTIEGGVGLYGPTGVGNPGQGFSGLTGTGGAGASVAQGAKLTLTYSGIFGGAGSDDSSYGAVGGKGGVGIAITGGTVISSQSTISGGVGGAGGLGYAPGGGGIGVLMNGGTLQNGPVDTVPTLYSMIYGGSVNDGGNYYSDGGTAVELTFDGTVNNLDSGRLGGRILGGSTNHGRGGIGIWMQAGGHINNDGIITGGSSGGGDDGGAGIEASGAYNGSVFDTAYVINTGKVIGGYASINTGGVGVEMYAGSYLKNEGAVYGGQGDNGGTGAIFNEAGANNINTAGASISGGLGHAGFGGIGVELSAVGSTLINRGSIVGGQAAYDAAGGAGVVIRQGATLTNSYVIVGGTGSDLGPGGTQVNLAPAAGVVIDGGSLYDSGAILPGGNIFNSVDFSGHAVQFDQVAGASDKMVLEPGWDLRGDVSGFSVGDTIEVLNLSYATALSQQASTQSPGGGFSTGVPFQTLQFAGSYSGANHLILTSINGGTGTEITVACYLRGTRIRRADAEVAIERLRVGDRVLTRSGELRPIRWIGRRSYPIASAGDRRDVLPVLIRQGALGDDLPLRDLRVSPEHALWIDGVLIPARALINAHSIVQDTTVADISYFHLEFDDHDVIYAEGALAESFVDDESRLQFDNVAEYWTRYPHDRPKPVRFCAPRLEGGLELEAVRHRLQAIAAPLMLSGSRPQGHGVRAAEPPSATA